MNKIYDIECYRCDRYCRVNEPNSNTQSKYKPSWSLVLKFLGATVTYQYFVLIVLCRVFVTIANHDGVHFLLKKNFLENNRKCCKNIKLTFWSQKDNTMRWVSACTQNFYGTISNVMFTTPATITLLRLPPIKGPVIK